MSIIDKSNVLLIGAGASTQFGLPLGGALLTQIAEQLKQDIKFLHGKLGVSYIHKLNFNLRLQLNSLYRSAPIIHTRLLAMIGDESTNDFLPKAKTELMLFCKLTRLLENQTADTIDDFIAQNPSVAEQAKISVAVQFFKKLYDYDSSLGKFIIRKLDNRNLLEERNWVHLLINLIRQGIRLQKVSPENPIQIITFNYDNGLEFILEKQFSNTEVELPNWRDVIKIHHIHGHMSDLPDNTLEPFKICQNWANSINVVHEENILPSVQRARVEASEALRKARNIYVCGFAFSGANIRLLGLNKIAGPYGGQNIHYCNYDNNVGLKHAVKRLNDHIYNVKNSGDDKISKFSRTPIELSGSRDNPMTITNWFYTGTPGELPS